MAEDVRAPADAPITDLAACDGYAVAAASLADGALTARVVDEVRADTTERLNLVAGATARIASGAPMPVGADAVVPLEDTDGGAAVVTFHRTVVPGANVRPRAGDAASGDLMLSEGQRVGPRQITLLSATGRGRVLVRPKPRVVIISVGDELLEPGRPAKEGQVYDANGHALSTGVFDAGGVALRVGAVPDEVGTLREAIEDQLVRADLVITTGGLSAGDTVRDVVGALGQVRFDRVAISPGGAFGVGVIEDGLTPVFCLPGNPVAVQVAYETFVRPALRKMAGYAELFRPSLRAAAVGRWDSPAGVRQFVPVKLSGSPREGYQAEALTDSLTDLARANALAVVREEVTEVAASEQVDCLILDA